MIFRKRKEARAMFMIRASLLWLTAAALLGNAQSQPNPIPWVRGLEQAQAEARKSGKPIFVVFR
jgi:hypothetical protein